MRRDFRKVRDGKDEIVTWKSLVALEIWLGLWYWWVLVSAGPVLPCRKRFGLEAIEML